MLTLTTGTAGIFGTLNQSLNTNVCQVMLSTVYENAGRDATNNASCPYAQVFGSLLYNSNSFPNGFNRESIPPRSSRSYLIFVSDSVSQ